MPREFYRVIHWEGVGPYRRVWMPETGEMHYHRDDGPSAETIELYMVRGFDLVVFDNPGGRSLEMTGPQALRYIEAHPDD